jgi:hypothetical protein
MELVSYISGRLASIRFFLPFLSFLSFHVVFFPGLTCCNVFYVVLSKIYLFIMLQGEVQEQNYTHSDICPLVFLIRQIELTGIGSRSGGITIKEKGNGTKSNHAGNA